MLLRGRNDGKGRVLKKRKIVFKGVKPSEAEMEKKEEQEGKTKWTESNKKKKERVEKKSWCKSGNA